LAKRIATIYRKAKPNIPFIYSESPILSIKVFPCLNMSWKVKLILNFFPLQLVPLCILGHLFGSKDPPQPSNQWKMMQYILRYVRIR
jgi:hypothetical protein